jgi:hypothetical protein
MCQGQLPQAGILLQFSTVLGIDPAPLLLAAGYPAPLLPAPTSRRRHAPDGGPAEQAGTAAPVQYPIPPAYRAVTDFCLRVAGESMWPHLHAGDIVGVQARNSAAHGQLVAARLNGAVTLARWFIDAGQGRLVPDNPAYPTLTIDTATMDFAILGVVAWHLHEWLSLQPDA